MTEPAELQDNTPSIFTGFAKAKIKSLCKKGKKPTLLQSESKRNQKSHEKMLKEDALLKAEETNRHLRPSLLALEKSMCLEKAAEVDLLSGDILSDKYNWSHSPIL